MKKEEKKLTNEEIIIAEVTEAYNNNQDAGCYVGELLRIIQRLQIENERLSLIAGILDKGVAVEIVNMQETIDKQKAEIERLTEENSILKGNPPMCVGRSNGKTIRAKLLDYDRLKKQNDELCKANPNIVILIEASERKYRKLYDEAKVILQQQAVKDTAKEIYKGLCNIKNGNWDKMKNAFLFGDESEDLKDLISSIIGVEVE